MRMRQIAPDTVALARTGDLDAIDAVLTGIQPAVFNLAVRMLGNREDARDACQEILLKVVTHLGGWRAEAEFSTWVFQVARNHLLTARTRTREVPDVSFDALGSKLADGLAYSASQADSPGLTPEDKAAAREVGIRCTQGMLMCLDRDLRLAYLLDVVFGLSSVDAAEVLGILPPAYRKRLSRARSALDAFAGRNCGLVALDAPCRCDRQLPAVLAAPGVGGAISLTPEEQAQAAQTFDGLLRMCDAAAVFRAHPRYRAPDAVIGAIRAVLRREGHWTPEPMDGPGT